MAAPRRLRRIVFTFLHSLSRGLRRATGAVGDGVHAIALTARGTVVLVRLTYADGWRLPGGGRKRAEKPQEAMLRELREEIGLLSHGGIEPLDDLSARHGFGFFLVREIVYQPPRRSLEVEAVREFDPDRLPADTTRGTLEIIEQWRGFTIAAGG